MLLCFGGRRRTRHHQIQWSEKDCLLYDEPHIIPNPCFLDTGKGQQSQLRWDLTSLLRHLDILLLIFNTVSHKKPQDFPHCVCVERFPGTTP